MQESMPLIILAGFLGSFHCAGMCGPFVAYYSLGAKSAHQNHLLYQTGRLTSYLALGVLAGSIGQGFLFLGGAVNAQKIVMISMGLVMICMGVFRYLPNKKSVPLRGFHQKIGKLMRSVTGQSNHPATAGLIGLGSTLLPCGYLYAFVFTAAATGHPGKAALTMAAFWLGTLPALLGLGLLTRYCSQTFLYRLQNLTPILLIIFGILAITGKWTALPGAPGDPMICH